MFVPGDVRHGAGAKAVVRLPEQGDSPSLAPVLVVILGAGNGIVDEAIVVSGEADEANAQNFRYQGGVEHALEGVGFPAVFDAAEPRVHDAANARFERGFVAEVAYRAAHGALAEVGGLRPLEDLDALHVEGADIPLPGGSRLNRDFIHELADHGLRSENVQGALIDQLGDAANGHLVRIRPPVGKVKPGRAPRDVAEIDDPCPFDFILCHGADALADVLGAFLAQARGDQDFLDRKRAAFGLLAEGRGDNGCVKRDRCAGKDPSGTDGGVSSVGFHLLSLV